AGQRGGGTAAVCAAGLQAGPVQAVSGGSLPADGAECGAAPWGVAGAGVRRYVRTLAPQRAALRKATVRYETGPGEQGQADWAYCGRLRDGQGQERPV